MKIIARTHSGFITEVSFKEVESLLALNDERRKKTSDSIHIGDELTFTIALSNLNLLKDVKLSGSYMALGQLKNAKDELDKIINSVEKTEMSLCEVQKQIKNGQS